MIRATLSALDRAHMRHKGGAYLNTLRLIGTYRCSHRSHRLGLRCLRYWSWDGYCAKHNESCWS